MTLFELLTSGFVTLFSAMMAVLWSKAERAEKISESNRVFLEQFIKNLDKTAQLTERLSSLEASVQVEIKNLSVSINRLEATVMRLSMHK